MLNHILYILKRPFHFIKTGLLNGLPAQMQYRFPARKLKIITITGTDGKTTSSTLLYHVLKTAKKKVGLLSTVAAYLGNKAIDTGFHVTSPQPRDLQRFMAEMVAKKYEYLVLELTSHGSYQYRDWGITPLFSGITNISQEHLDYHITYEEYLKAKAHILSKASVAVINQDDISYHPLRKTLTKTNLVTYSKDSSLPVKVKKAIQNRFPEPYNQMNARLVYTLARLVGVSDADFADAIASFSGIPGRMQSIPNKKKIAIIVDFAHTPQGVKSVLRAVRDRLPKEASLWVILGCAGLRDSKKRPLMGEIATKYADTAVFTSEDPRTESIWSIIRQMKESPNCQLQKVVSIANRAEAISYTLEHARPGDTVCVLGKGHEKSMNILGKEYPWDDVTAITAILDGKKPQELPIV